MNFKGFFLRNTLETKLLKVLLNNHIFEFKNTNVLQQSYSEPTLRRFWIRFMFHNRWSGVTVKLGQFPSQTHQKIFNSFLGFEKLNKTVKLFHCYFNLLLFFVKLYDGQEVRGYQIMKLLNVLRAFISIHYFISFHLLRLNTIEVWAWVLVRSNVVHCYLN